MNSSNTFERCGTCCNCRSILFQGSACGHTGPCSNCMTRHTVNGKLDIYVNGEKAEVAESPAPKPYGETIEETRVLTEKLLEVVTILARDIRSMKMDLEILRMRLR